MKNKIFIFGLIFLVCISFVVYSLDYSVDNHLINCSNAGYTFCDDFENGTTLDWSKWDAGDTGKYSVATGNLVLASAGSVDNRIYWQYTKLTAGVNQCYQLRVDANSGILYEFATGDGSHGGTNKVHLLDFETAQPRVIQPGDKTTSQTTGNITMMYCKKGSSYNASVWVNQSNLGYSIWVENFTAKTYAQVNVTNIAGHFCWGGGTCKIHYILLWNGSESDAPYYSKVSPPSIYSPNFTRMGYNESNTTLPKLINFTCGNNVSNLWFGLSNPPTNLILNQTLFGNYTLDLSNILSNKTYYYNAGCNGTGNLNSSVFYFHYDADIPQIVFNDYDSTVYDSINNTCINYTVSDMFLSYSNFSIIGTNPTFMNDTNLTVSNKTFYQCYNFMNQSLGNYEIKVCAKDSYSNSPEMDFFIKDTVTNYKIETEFLDKKNNIKFKRNVEILENKAIQEINRECYVNNDFSDRIHIKSSFNCHFADKEKIKITYSCIDGCTGFRLLSDRGKNRLIDSSGNIMVSFDDDEAKGRIVEYTQNAGLTETIITPAQNEKNDFIDIGDVVNGLNTNCESVFITYAAVPIPDVFTDDEKMFILWIMLIILGIAIVLTLLIKIVFMYLITALLFFFSAIVTYYTLPNDISFNVIISVFMTVFGICVFLYSIFYRR